MMCIPPSGRSTGSRGCGTKTVPSLSNAPALILLHLVGVLDKLFPLVQLGFVRDASSWPIEFRLYEHDLSNDTFKLVKEIKDEGFKKFRIMVLSLSKFI